MRGISTRACTGIVDVALLLIAAACSECAGPGGVDFVEGFDKYGTDGGDARYNEDNPHFGSGAVS